MIHYANVRNKNSIQNEIAMFELDSNLMTNVRWKLRLSWKQVFRKIEEGMIKYWWSSHYK